VAGTPVAVTAGTGPSGSVGVATVPVRTVRGALEGAVAGRAVGLGDGEGAGSSTSAGGSVMGDTRDAEAATGLDSLARPLAVSFARSAPSFLPFADGSAAAVAPCCWPGAPPRPLEVEPDVLVEPLDDVVLVEAVLKLEDDVVEVGADGRADDAPPARGVPRAVERPGAADGRPEDLDEDGLADEDVRGALDLDADGEEDDDFPADEDGWADGACEERPGDAASAPEAPMVAPRLRTARTLASTASARIPPPTVVPRTFLPHRHAAGSRR
jgi:hypothetical protein